MKDCPQCKLRYPDDVSFCFADGWSLEPLPDPRLGNVVLGRYVLEAVIGARRCATVYRARDRFSARRAAAKIYASGPKDALRGAIALGDRLVHPNIAKLYDAGETEDGEVVAVTELAEMPSLASLLEKGKLPLARALDIGVQVARGLARAHDLAVIHGDLRAENVFVEAGDRVMIVDLATARVHEPLRGAASLAPDPMTGPFSDLYALGVLLFHVSTSTLPFEASDAAALAALHKTQAPPRVSERAVVPPALDALIGALLAKTPMGRPVDAHTVVTALEEIAAAGSIALREHARAEGPKPTVAADLSAFEKRWKERLTVLTEMTKRAYPGGPPPHVAKALDGIGKRVAVLDEIRTTAGGALEREAIVAEEARESLERIGDAMATVMLDASRLRQEVRAQAGAMTPDLAAQLADVDYQVKDLRQSLDALLNDLRERQTPANGELRELGGKWAETEVELLTDAARFCAPLRARPELVPLFNKLAG